MYKRIMALLLCCVMLCAVFTTAVSAAEPALSGNCGRDGGSNLTWAFDRESGTLTISGTGAMENYSTSSDDKLLTPWAGLLDEIKTVVLPEGLTSIGDCAFSDCKALSQITLPKSLKVIADYAFSGAGLQSVEIPDSVIAIGNFAFSRCANLLTVSLPDTLEDLGFNAFYNCGLYLKQSLSDADAVYIDHYLVDYLVDSNKLKDLETFNIEDGTVGIADRAFYETSVYNLYVPSSMRLLSPDAFRGATIRNIYFAEGIQVIGANSFGEAEHIHHIEFPASVKKIESFAFADFFTCNIDELCFQGAAPELAKDALAYLSEADSVVYFKEGQAGWTYPTWNGVTTRYWDGKAVVSTGFWDCKDNAWYRDAVNYVTGNGLMNGVGDNSFDPEGSMTRAMLVTVLWRYAGSPKEGKNSFTDVANGQWYTDAIAWAASKDIVKGKSATTFDPNGKVTREQVATILYRYAGLVKADTSKRGSFTKFADGNSVNAWAKDGLSWAVANEIIGGSDGKLLPQGDATRAQVAAILMRFNNSVKQK